MQDTKVTLNKFFTGRVPRFGHSLALAATVASLSICSCIAHANSSVSNVPQSHSLRSVPRGGVYQSTNDISLNFVSADINDVLKAMAVQSGANIVSSSDVKGSVTVSLNHVTLEQALDMVARLSGFQFVKANNSFIVGSPSSILTFTGGPTDSTIQTDVIPLHYSNYDDASAILKQRFPAMQLSQGKETSGSKVDTWTNSIVITSDASTIAQSKTLISTWEDYLENRISQEKTFVYVPHYSGITDLMNVLATMVPSLYVIPGPSDGFTAAAPSAGAAAASSSASAAGSVSTGSSSGSSGSSSSGGSGAGSGLTGSTMLIMSGSDADIERAKAILAQIDVKPAMILYEAKVTEINDQDQHNIGLNWNFQTATTTFGEQGATGILGGVAGLSSSPVNLGRFTRTPISNLATATLDALFTNGDAKLLADPNIEAIDGFPANVFIGDTVNYVSSITSSTTGENITTGSVNVGVTLRVTGKVNPDGYVTLNIHPEVSTISSYLSTPGGGQLPNVATRFADTTVRVKNGETIAIGGLIQTNDIVNITKVPFFGDLPFFGQLFKDTQHQKNKTEVVFFLKTTIDTTT